MRPGKNKDRYFSNKNIIEQAEAAIVILCKHYPQYEHVLIYNNALTHLKQAPDALSVHWMVKNIPKTGKNWGVEATKSQVGPCYWPDQIQSGWFTKEDQGAHG